MPGRKILIVEITTAGGLGSEKDRIESISIEGLAMLRSLVEDAMAGGFEVHGILQEAIVVPRVSSSRQGVTWHRTATGKTLKSEMKAIAPSMDFCIVVAPEFGDYLVEYTRLLESCHCTLLGPSSGPIVAASDKRAALQRLAAAGVKTPHTQALDDFISNPGIAYPVVVKPNHGAGSIGVFIARDDAELNDAIETNEGFSFTRDNLIVQSFVKGASLSASIVCINGRASLLGINEQDVVLGTARASGSKYEGGVVGQLHPGLATGCQRVADAIVRLFRLEGYFGFDFILEPDGTQTLVEINPRITTSFVGLKLLQHGSLLRFVADRKAGLPAVLPWKCLEAFTAYKIINAHPRRNNCLLGSNSAEEGCLASIEVSTGKFSSFVAACGRTRDAATTRLRDIVAEL